MSKEKLTIHIDDMYDEINSNHTKRGREIKARCSEFVVNGFQPR